MVSVAQSNDEFSFDDDDEPTSSDGFKKLRDAYKEQGKANAALRKQLDEIQAESRKRNVKDVLAAKGFNPKVAALIPSDIDPTEEAVSKWLDDYADVFGAKPNDAPAEGDGVASDVDVQSHQRIQDSTGQARSVPADIAQQIAATKNVEELNSLLASYS